MKIAVMLGGVLLVIVASSWAHGDEPRPGEGLDPTRISDGNTFLSHKSSIGERAQGHLLQKPELQATNVSGEDDGSVKARAAKGCRTSKKCSKQGGECVSRGSCNGVATKGCKKKCDCCITVETTTAPPTAAPPTCPPGPTTVSCPDLFVEIGKCCYFFSVDNAQPLANWHDAKLNCKALGSDLFEVGTGGCEGDVNLMEIIATKRAYTWSGANSLDGGATWQWERTGDPFPHNSNMWWHNDPRTDNLNCMHAFITSWTTWRAVFGIASCDTQRNHYVCQVFK